MSVRLRFTPSSLLVLTALAPLACGGGQSEAPPPEAPPAAAPMAAAPPPAPTPAATTAPEAAPAAAPQAAAPAAPPADQHRPGHGHGHGMAALFVESLTKVDLRPDQKAAVDAAIADLEKQGEAHGDAGKQLAGDIADGIAAGKIDHKKTDADVKNLVSAIDASKAGVQDAVNKIHKALDADQRKKLVEAMRAKGEEMRGKSEQEGEDKAHEERLKMLSEGIGLTPEQTDKLKAKLKDVMKGHMATMKTNMGAMQKHMKAIGDAFETDKFDAKKAGVGEHAGDMAKAMAKHRVQVVEAVLAVITPEQRAKFAEHVRSHAEGG
jgi:Spy/CpxP family protein refolding chaperone